MSILAGIGSLVDEWLELEPKGRPPYYRHRAAAKTLSARKPPFPLASPFLNRAYDLIDKNWQAGGERRPSRENWRWKKHLSISPANTSKEVILERDIARLGGDNWSNQMPTASGLLDSVADKRAAVDLVYREAPLRYSFVELKVDADHPLFAAIEILMYGLIFIWSKKNMARLEYDATVQPLLAANAITLMVLAPAAYYKRFDLSALATSIDTGVCDLGLESGLEMQFTFRQLGAGYEDSGNHGAFKAALSYLKDPYR